MRCNASSASSNLLRPGEPDEDVGALRARSDSQQFFVRGDRFVVARTGGTSLRLRLRGSGSPIARPIAWPYWMNFRSFETKQYPAHSAPVRCYVQPSDEP